MNATGHNLDCLKADPLRQAIPALQGYLYQIWHSLLRWVSLDPRETLVLEGAEDADVLTATTAETVQVKHVNTPITLNSKQVRDAIIHFWKHQENNPDRKVQFRFLTTADRTLEQNRFFGAERGLDYWDSCRTHESNLVRLRTYLRSMKEFPETLKTFLATCANAALRDDLICRIEWDTCQQSIKDVETLVKRAVCEYGLRQYPVVPPQESERVIAHLLKRVTEVIRYTTDRQLTLSDFARLYEDITAVRIPRHAFQVGRQGIWIPQQDIITVPSASLVDSSVAAIDDPSSTLAEGAWPLHQTLEKPYNQVARTIELALDEGNLDIALPEFRRTLYFSGYHEEWLTRQRLTDKLLKQKLGSRDAGWVTLKGDAYMRMEQGDFLGANAAIRRALSLYQEGHAKEGIGDCLAYLGDLHSKVSNVAKALEYKHESLKYLIGVSRQESQLQIQLLELQYFSAPSQDKLSRLFTLGERLREIRSWRYWLTELERAKTLRDLGDRNDALTIAKHVEMTFRREITMERTRTLAIRLIQDITQ